MGWAALWAATHAWRAVAKLGSQAAIAPLLSLLTRIDDYDDYRVIEEIPEALGQIGREAIPMVTEYLDDVSHSESARIAAATSLGRIAELHPESRSECIAALSAELEKFSINSNTLNRFLIVPLAQLKAVEAAPLLQRAIAAGQARPPAIRRIRIRTRSQQLVRTVQAPATTIEMPPEIASKIG